MNLHMLGILSTCKRLFATILRRHASFINKTEAGSRFSTPFAIVIGAFGSWALLAVVAFVFFGTYPWTGLKCLIHHSAFRFKYIEPAEKDARSRAWPVAEHTAHAALRRGAGTLPESSPVCSFASGVEAAIFMHIYPSTSNAWRMILDDMVRTIQYSPAAACGVPVYYNLPAGVPWPYGSVDRTFAPMNKSELGRGQPQIELQTIASIYEWCNDHPTALAAYIHDKGSRMSPDDSNRFMRQWDWRRVHEYFLLEVPQGCFKALQSGAYDTCGAEKRERPVIHYSGNFWWARCDHVNRLEHPFRYEWKASPMLSPEFWLGSKHASERAFNCYNLTGNHYEVSFPRSLYVGSQCNLDMIAGV